MNPTKMVLGSLAVASLLALPVSALSLLETAPVTTPPWELVECGMFDAHELAETGGIFTFPYPAGGDDMTITVHLLCLAEEGDVFADTDCTATSWSHTGWRWTAVENHRVDTWNPSGISASTVVSQFASSAEVWDGTVAANIFGSFSSGGSRNNIPVFDGFNQHGWKDLASTTIASTWTWSSGGIASESDAAYNTDFAWSSSGQSGRMDLRNIATHELGHTFGMGHSSSSSVNSCLTMYPSGALGETQKRTLGDGDINGIKARYP